MAGSWKEIRGMRRQVDSLQARDYIVGFSAVVATAPPTLGQALADISTAGGTFGSSGLDEEPEAVQVSQAYRATPLLSVVTVTFRARFTGP